MEGVTSWLDAAGLSQLQELFQRERFSVWMMLLDDRPALLRRLQRLGVMRLVDRQKLANVLSRVQRTTHCPVKGDEELNAPRAREQAEALLRTIASQLWLSPVMNREEEARGVGLSENACAVLADPALWDQPAPDTAALTTDPPLHPEAWAIGRFVGAAGIAPLEHMLQSAGWSPTRVQLACDAVALRHTRLGFYASQLCERGTEVPSERDRMKWIGGWG